MGNNTKVVAGGKATEDEKAAVEAVDVNTQNVAADTADIPTPSKEEVQFARIKFRENFNEKFSKWCNVEAEEADDDFIAEAKKELDAAADEVKNGKYKIADADDKNTPLKTIQFIRRWNRDDAVWEKAEWRGVVMLDKVLGKIEDELAADATKNAEIDYLTLVYLRKVMMNPKGVGLASAIKMGSEYENYDFETSSLREVADDETPITYSGILSKIEEHCKAISLLDRKIAILKERWQYALAGVRMTLKISTIEEFVEFAEELSKLHTAMEAGLENSDK